MCGAVCHAEIEGLRFRALRENATQAKCRNTMQKKKKVAERGKEPFGSIPGRVYSVDSEKESRNLFKFLCVNVLVLAVNLNHPVKAAVVFGEKPRGFNNARPSGGKGSLKSM